MQILEEGFVTDNSGRKVNFNNCIIILTGNIGSEKVSKPMIGFNQAESAAQLKDKLMVELKGFFKPEFLNRLNEIILFQDFDSEQLKKIVKLEINKISAKLKGRNISVGATPTFINYIAEEARKQKMGARPVKRLIQKNLENELSRLLISKELDDNSQIKFSYLKEEVNYKIKEV